MAVAMFASFMALIFSGFPVAWVLGGLAVAFTAFAIIAEHDFGILSGVDWSYASLVVDRSWDVMNNWVLVALPMFIFMGVMLDRSGVAGDLMLNVSRLFGRVRGGLALERGYQAELAAGTVCSVGTLGILIPPSIMLVLMAERLALSVGDLFLGAFFPGVLLGGLYVAYILILSLLKPDVAPVPHDAPPVDLRVVLDVVISVLPTAGLILAVLGSIFFGIATPTEAAGVGAFGATLLALGKRRLSGDGLREVLTETTRTTGFIFAILLGATAFSLVLRGLGGDDLIERVLIGLPFSPDGILITILAVTFLLGFFLDWIEITLIVLPLVSPVVAELGFDLVWFTVLFAVCLQTSFLTPPVGFAIFYLKGVAPAGVDVQTIYRGVAPFIALQILGLVIIFFWSQLVTWLPGVAYSNP
jgi:tripartite ATP-independent transporter DctM subunit